MSAPSSWELAQHLYDKNIELENRRRKSVQARVPSDPNAWQQMRENYEAIILEDHAFSEQHSIEYALWHLHYRRIEEFRAHFNAALASSGSTTSQSGKALRPDRINKIRMQFKTFLSEATGFYHDFILKIRARYGLPLGNFSEASENQIVTGKDAKKSAEMRKGLISCHRCLIYLGDLARYKGLYGEGDSKSRDYAAASSYYLQAASLWPSSGNPHHQLAILATYSGDELVAVYRYFRSLAVDNPFSTARDNLIVAFEKNRQSYSHLNGDTKASIKESAAQMDPKGRAKGEATAQPQKANSDTSSAVGKAASMHVTYKAFCNCFVRLNGIIFTHTSLEMFEEVLFLVSSALHELLTSGLEEKLNFGADAVENGFTIVRVVCILIFTVHNANREAEGQTYADIVQRAVLLQDALTAVFELMGLILERCAQLSDPSSSYLLPGILVFLEWLACCPDVAIGRDLGDKEGSVMSKFWNFCISLLNELVSTNLVLIDDEDETCFANMSRYGEGETENRLALWEDFELRGFLPLQAAQTILDFSRMHSFENEGNKEKISRVKRIVAVGKALAGIVKVDQKTVSFDSKQKKFVIDAEHQMLDDILPTFSLSDPIFADRVQERSANLTGNLAVMQPKPQLYFEGEEEDEVIVFKPTTVDKETDATSSKWTPHDDLEPDGNIYVDVPQLFGSGVSAAHCDVLQQTALQSSGINHFFQNLPSHQPHSPMWLLDQQSALANGMKGLTLMENGHFMKPGIQDTGLVPTASISLPMRNSASISSDFTLYSQGDASGTIVQPKINAPALSGHRNITSDGDLVACTGISPLTLAVNTSSALPAGPRKNPVKRPLRHNGPPPGFSPLPPKQVNDSIFESDLMGKNPLMDDYKWLDDYQLTLPTNGLGPHQSLNQPLQSGLQHISNSNGSLLMNKFPFPGKQVPILPSEGDLPKGRQDHLAESVLLNNEQLQQQQYIKGGQQSLPFEYQQLSIWTNHHNV